MTITCGQNMDNFFSNSIIIKLPQVLIFYVLKQLPVIYNYVIECLISLKFGGFRELEND